MTDSNRIAWLQSQVAEKNVDSLVVFSSAWHTMGATNAVQVLTGFKNMGDGAIVLNRDSSRTLIVSPLWDGDRASEHAEGIRVVATDDFAYTVADELKGKRGAPRQIGVAGPKPMA